MLGERARVEDPVGVREEGGPDGEQALLCRSCGRRSVEPMDGKVEQKTCWRAFRAWAPSSRCRRFRGSKVA